MFWLHPSVLRRIPRSELGYASGPFPPGLQRQIQQAAQRGTWYAGGHESPGVGFERDAARDRAARGGPSTGGRPTAAGRGFVDFLVGAINVAISKASYGLVRNVVRAPAAPIEIPTEVTPDVSGVGGDYNPDFGPMVGGVSSGEIRASDISGSQRDTTPGVSGDVGTDTGESSDIEIPRDPDGRYAI